MSRSVRSMLIGVAVACLVGLLKEWLAPVPGFYRPQTDAGRVAEVIGYLLPWALAGAGIGYLVARWKKV